ncbi:MAG TPA: energy transducer TonB [Opitutaceae bacterium]|nr:energy transducer TonB [Opitutaceae bacterium]
MKNARQLLIGITLLLSLGSASSLFADEVKKPLVYNNVEGDGSQELDRSIKKAYAGRYVVEDTKASDSYAEPSPTSGSMPGAVKDDKGGVLGGYVLVAYIVGTDGKADDPVVLRTSDERLSKAALDAMGHWRFKPGKVAGQEVASTAAQEFNFGPVRVQSGFTLKHLILYQPNDVVVRRMPPKTEADAYLDRLTEVAHNFFVGNPAPETLHIIVLLMPAGRPRVWFLSSNRPGNARELQPLKALLEAVKPLPVKEGPVLFTLSGVVMGGDGLELPADQSPVPAEWHRVEEGLKEPLPITGDEFLGLAYSQSP